MLSFFLAGFVGGVFRGVVGLIKYSQSYKDVEIRPWYFTGMVVVSGLIGLATAWVVRDLGVQLFGVEELTSGIGVLVGYGGGDILENLYKIVSKKENVFGS